MTKQEHNRTVKAIDRAFARLAGVLQNTWEREWREYLELNRQEERDRREYLELNRQEERDHRRFTDGCVNGLTAAQAVRLFAVRQLLELVNRKTRQEPKVAEFFYIRKSVFAAWALYVKASQHIHAQFSQAEAEAACLWDYAALNNPTLD